MDEKYQLVFRGEIAEGQHRAVVKKRLAEALKLDDARADRLFTGTAVVVKKSADAKTAAAFQALFKKAGARLRVKALAAGAQGSAEPARAPAAVPAEPVPTTRAPASTPPAAQSDSSGFKLVSEQETDARVAELRQASVEFTAPDYSVAEAGADIGEPRVEASISLPEADFTVAEAGADLLTEPAAVEVVELGELNFDLAEVGATIGDDSPKPVPPAPDTSHLQINKEA